jgi:hypothetical protein
LYGPYKIIQRIGQVMYELDFPYSCIHKGFHVSLLKKVLGQTMSVHIELPKLDEEGKLILEPKKLQIRILYLFELEPLWST